MRLVNRIASSVLGLALIGGGLLAAVEAVLAFAGRAPVLPLRQWYARLVDTEYTDRWVLLIAIGIGLLGLVILIAQLRPQRPDRFRLGPVATDDATRWSMQRHSLEQQVAAAVTGVSGVGAAHVEVAGKETDWSVRVRATGRPDQRDSVQSAARAALGRLDAPPTVGLRIDLREPRIERREPRRVS
ncbi:hypothetical protein F4553_007654 [Allocatelliglobosispora scoriae]|uniref:DUF6286 domain-containing protein n=1 Tax=Allocatelliglobosispora scoriae TaxID=643052 RepID=A0A841C5K0_9ACTN|nr:DUF6286 domain-containing protein [Allocatelliglobosispora scoriae]MBB5874220.1 hypothetical protein [Allocatelliglobosispora scoriae]